MINHKMCVCVTEKTETFLVFGMLHLDVYHSVKYKNDQRRVL